MKKLLVIGMCSVMVLAAGGVDASAASIESSEVLDYRNEHSVGVMSTDVIVYKFREYKHRAQYRRWNATRKRWVDPRWINL